MQLHIILFFGQGAIRGQDVFRSSVIPIAPQDTNRRQEVLELVQVIEHLRAVAGNAGSVAEAFRPEDRVGTAIAEAHCDRAAVELGQSANARERVGHVSLAFSNLVEPRLRALLRASVVVGERARKRAPEQVRRGSNVAGCGELIGNRGDIVIDAVNRRSEHNRRGRSAGLGYIQIAIEIAAFARADLDPLLRHHTSPLVAALAADAVGFELVSRSNSLLTGKLTRNFAKSGRPARFSRPVSVRIPWLA